jgi:hypothetical protein
MAEFFKLEGGKIRQIEGISIALPFGAKAGWENAPVGNYRGESTGSLEVHLMP